MNRNFSMAWWHLRCAWCEIKDAWWCLIGRERTPAVLYPPKR